MPNNTLPRIRAMQAFFKHEPPSIVPDDSFNKEEPRIREAEMRRERADENCFTHKKKAKKTRNGLSTGG